ncbi:hypothetical protein D3C87_942280 [compost metagenome]
MLQQSQIPCGSEPARESTGSDDINVDPSGLFASRLAPTGYSGVHGACSRCCFSLTAYAMADLSPLFAITPLARPPAIVGQSQPRALPRPRRTGPRVTKRLINETPPSAILPAFRLGTRNHCEELDVAPTHFGELCGNYRHHVADGRRVVFPFTVD